MQILVILEVVLSYPLQIIPCRYAIISSYNDLIKYINPWMKRKPFRIIYAVEFEFKGFTITTILIFITLVAVDLDLQKYFNEKVS